MYKVTSKASGCAIEGIQRDALAHQQLQFELLDAGMISKPPMELPEGLQARFILERTPFPQRPSFPLVPEGISSQLSNISMPSNIETLFDYGDLVFATLFTRMELVLRGHHDTELVDSHLPAFLKALAGSFNGMFRGSWRSSIKWLGMISRSVGMVLLPLGIPAHAGWSQAFVSDDSPDRMLQDLADMRSFRGSMHFAQWRLSAWNVMISGSSAMVPVGLFVQTLFEAHIRSNSPDPLFISNIVDFSQSLETPVAEDEDENLVLALRLHPVNPQSARASQASATFSATQEFGPPRQSQ